MPRQGRRRKKNRTVETNHDAATSALTTVEKIPKSLILKKGKTNLEIAELVMDMRRLMLPYTAMNFKEDAKNRKLTLSQYATHLALPMGITHILQFSQSNESLQLRLGRLPAGPVLSFRVHSFSLSKDIQRLQRRPISTAAKSMTQHPAITVTNHFPNDGNPEVKLMNITFQNLFPQINVSNVQLHECKRIVLFDRMERTGRIHMRQYAITTKQSNVNKRLYRLQKSNHLPNLHNCQDIADYLQGNAYKSDGSCKSDYTSDEEDTKTVASTTSSKASQSALKLVELGPRLELELIKVEKDLDHKNATILYHKELTQEQLAAKASKRQEQKSLKEERQRIQAENVERKEAVRKRKRDKKRIRQTDDEPATPTTVERIEGVSSSSEDESDEEKD